jgi:hypothetical protein
MQWGIKMRKLDDETSHLNITVPMSLMKKISEFRRRQTDFPNVSETLRRLLARGLEHDAAERKTQMRRGVNQ